MAIKKVSRQNTVALLGRATSLGAITIFNSLRLYFLPERKPILKASLRVLFGFIGLLSIWSVMTGQFAYASISEVAGFYVVAPIICTLHLVVLLVVNNRSGKLPRSNIYCLTKLSTLAHFAHRARNRLLVRVGEVM